MGGDFSFCKDEKESGLLPADDEDAAGRKINPKDVYCLMGEQYKMTALRHEAAGKGDIMAMHCGMDVSSYQGAINWKRIKDSSMEFALLRASHGSGSPERQTDACFHKNAYEAAMAGLFIGAYHTTYAATEDEVKREAALFLKVIDGYSLAYPVAVNMEDYLLRYLPPDRLQKIASGWCSALRDAGYYPLIFGTPELFRERLKTLPDGAEIWLSEPGDSPTFEGSYGIRQVSLDGKLDGVAGRFNLDLTDRDYPALIFGQGLNGFSPPAKSERKPEPTEPRKPRHLPAPPAEEEPDRNTVTVKEGETLFDIASRFGMTEKELLQYRGNRSVLRGTDALRPGTVLNVPAPLRWPLFSPQIGDRVEYYGPVCINRFGWFPHGDVGGVFTVTKLSPDRETGVRLDRLGWVRRSGLVKAEN